MNYRRSVSILYRVHQRIRQGFFFEGGGGHNTARIASSNTIFKFFWVRAEHSRYFTALTSLAIARPWGYVIGANFLSFNFSIVLLSSRRSSFVPTSIIGVLGQWWRTSGTHYKKSELCLLDDWIEICIVWEKLDLPLLAHFQRTQDSQEKSIWGKHPFAGMIAAASDRNLLDRQYPINPNW